MAAALKDPQAWFAAGRIKACHLMPYLSAGVMGLVPYRVPGLGTLAVSARAVLLWDPDLHTQWTVEQLAWVILHEVGHYMREHAARRERAGADPEAWNLAGDAEINDDLTAAGAKFPPIAAGPGVPPEKVGQPGGVLPSHLGCPDGRLAEEYYAALRKRGGLEGGKGKPRPGWGGGCEGCGSGAGHHASASEADVPSHLGKSSAEQKRVQRVVAEAIRKESSRGRGSVPAGLRRWADEVLGQPQVPWQQTLARLVRNAVAFRPGAGDYRYDRPSRRQGAWGYGPGSPVFPAMRQPVPAVSVVVDTSGSMGADALGAALGEVQGILAAVGAGVTLLACDAQVHEVRRVRSVREAVQSLKGGGGTNMRPAIEQAVAGRPRPEVLVVLTDGYVGDVGAAPPTNVVWVVIRPEGAGEWAPPYGQAVHVDTSRDAMRRRAG